MTGTKTSAENLFSLPICVITELTKSLSHWERWRRSRRRGQMVAMMPLSPAIAGALPEGEPLGARNLMGMRFARSRRCLQRCNTKSKLAINLDGGIMEDILELILTILFKPFESKYDGSFGRIKNIRNKGLRILLRLLLITIPVALIFGIYCLCNYLFRGYWI